MKVYYIGSGYDGCYYVRCLLPQRANGWDGQIKSFVTPQDSNEVMFQEAMQSDVIVFHRPTERNKVEAMKLLKEYGKMVVMDNDDTYIPDSGVQTVMFGNKRKILDTMNQNLKEAARVADLVTCSTEWLANEYRELNPNVEVLKNCIDPDDWEKPKRNEGNKIRVGLVGSVTSADYTEIKNVLKFISDSPDYELIVFGLPPKQENTKFLQETLKEHIDFWESLNIEWQPLVEAVDYKHVLNELRLDIALIPRTDNYFNKAKSNIKYLEMSMLEIPCIVSSFKDSPYENDRALKCETEEDWFSALNYIENKHYRQELGIIAKEHVLKEYNINTLAINWEKAYAKNRN